MAYTPGPQRNASSTTTPPRTGSPAARASPVRGRTPQAEHHQVGGQKGPVRQLHTGDALGTAQRPHLRAQAHRHAQPGETAAQHGPGLRVQMTLHQMRRLLDDLHREPQRGQRTGGAHAEHPAAHDHGPPAARGLLGQPTAVVERTEGVHPALEGTARGTQPADRRDDRLRPGGQHQHVIGGGLPTGEPEGTGARVHRGHLGSGAQHRRTGRAGRCPTRRTGRASTSASSTRL
ncbi:hypothetical protein GCM10020000_00720 [Streptomyces olivoverticillatus]